MENNFNFNVRSILTIKDEKRSIKLESIDFNKDTLREYIQIGSDEEDYFRKHMLNVMPWSGGDRLTYIRIKDYEKGRIWKYISKEIPIEKENKLILLLKGTFANSDILELLKDVRGTSVSFSHNISLHVEV